LARVRVGAARAVGRDGESWERASQRRGTGLVMMEGGGANACVRMWVGRSRGWSEDGVGVFGGGLFVQAKATTGPGTGLGLGLRRGWRW